MGCEVLVVDDNVSARRMFARTLRKAGVQPLEAENAGQALPLLPRAAFAIVDLQLSDHPLDRSGFEVIAAARDRGIPAVVISAQ